MINPSVGCLRVLPGTWSHLWFAGVRECPPWCFIVGATVTVHQFFCILQFGWLLVLSLHKEDYLQIFKCVHFDYTAFAVSEKVGYS